MPGVSFDRVADIYDATRGGERRAGQFASAVAPWLLGPNVAELGVGTGLVADALADLRPVGVDLSEPMLRRALDRVGPRVAIADVDALPFSDDCLDSTLFVWVLQLVDDPIVTLAEAARVVRPGGRIVTVTSTAEFATDEFAPIDRLRALTPERLGPDELVAEAPPPLGLVHRGVTPWAEFESTPATEIDHIERRIFSSLFDVDDAAWQRVVEPVLEDLRALPDPDRPRIRRNRNPLLVWDVLPRP